jgi:hypothetical protein
MKQPSLKLRRFESIADLLVRAKSARNTVQCSTVPTFTLAPSWHDS